MKKILFVLLFLFSGLSSQVLEKGVIVGLNFAKITDFKNHDYSYMTGYAIGGYCKFDYANKFAIRPELIYSIQGYSENNITVHMNYLVLPVLGVFDISNNFNFFAGPYIDYFTDGTKKDTWKITKPTGGLILGIEITDASFSYQGRINLGIININSSTDSEAYHYFHRLFQLILGYNF